MIMFTVKIVNSECGNSPEFPIQTLNDASAKYRAFIESNGLGASGAGSCYILHNGGIVAHVSYNGKVWEGKRWTENAKQLFP